jgi:hypothetical protein
MTLAAALTDAQRRGLRISDAMWAVDPPRRSSREIETLTREEVGKLLDIARGDPLEAVFVLAATLGLREGELLGLTWQRVDLAQRRLTVNGNATRTLDGSRAITEPKTAAGRRVLRLPSIAVDALERTCRLGELVWPGPEGQLLPPSTFYKQWMAMRRRAGIRAVSFHALRHTAATLAIEGGQPLQAVARTSEPDAEDRLLAAGASRVICPYTMAGNRMAHLAVQPLAADYIDIVIQGQSLGVQIEERLLPPGSPLGNRTVGDIRRKELAGAQILAMEHDSELITSVDDGLVVTPGDRILVAGTEAQLAHFDQAVAQG